MLAYLALIEPRVEKLVGSPVVILFWNVFEAVGWGGLDALEAKPTVCLLELETVAGEEDALVPKAIRAELSPGTGNAKLSSTPKDPRSTRSLDRERSIAA